MRRSPHRPPRPFRRGFTLLEILLTLALIGQLIGVHWQSWLPGAEQKSSIFSGVHAAVYTFMSHII
jgi:prepilin-type N-terminal cleavage/methylation domain-containing protein